MRSLVLSPRKRISCIESSQWDLLCWAFAIGSPVLGPRHRISCIELSQYDLCIEPSQYDTYTTAPLDLHDCLAGPTRLSCRTYTTAPLDLHDCPAGPTRLPYRRSYRACPIQEILLSGGRALRAKTFPGKTCPGTRGLAPICFESFAG